MPRRPPKKVPAHPNWEALNAEKAQILKLNKKKKSAQRNWNLPFTLM